MNRQRPRKALHPWNASQFLNQRIPRTKSLYIKEHHPINFILKGYISKIPKIQGDKSCSIILNFFSHSTTINYACGTQCSALQVHEKPTQSSMGKIACSLPRKPKINQQLNYDAWCEHLSLEDSASWEEGGDQDGLLLRGPML